MPLFIYSLAATSKPIQRKTSKKRAIQEVTSDDDVSESDFRPSPPKKAKKAPARKVLSEKKTGETKRTVAGKKKTLKSADSSEAEDPPLVKKPTDVASKLATRKRPRELESTDLEEESPVKRPKRKAAATITAVYEDESDSKSPRKKPSSAKSKKQPTAAETTETVSTPEPMAIPRTALSPIIEIEEEETGYEPPLPKLAAPVEVPTRKLAKKSSRPSPVPPSLSPPTNEATKRVQKKPQVVVDDDDDDDWQNIVAKVLKNRTRSSKKNLMEDTEDEGSRKVSCKAKAAVASAEGSDGEESKKPKRPPTKSRKAKPVDFVSEQDGASGGESKQSQSLLTKTPKTKVQEVSPVMDNAPPKVSRPRPRKEEVVMKSCEEWPEQSRKRTQEVDEVAEEEPPKKKAGKSKKTSDVIHVVEDPSNRDLTEAVPKKGSSKDTGLEDVDAVENPRHAKKAAKARKPVQIAEKSEPEAGPVVKASKQRQTVKEPIRATASEKKAEESKKDKTKLKTVVDKVSLRTISLACLYRSDRICSTTFNLHVLYLNLLELYDHLEWTAILTN